MLTSKIRIHPTTNGTFDNHTMSPTVSKQNGETPSITLQTEDEISMQNLTKAVNKRMRKRRNKWTLIVTFISLILIIIFITIAYLVSKGLLSPTKEKTEKKITHSCDDTNSCKVLVVETIPNVLKYKSGSPLHDEISKHWRFMIQTAQESIDIVSFYWTMNGTDMEGGPYPQAKIGENILNDIIKASQRGVQVRIVQTIATKQFPQKDTKRLMIHPNIHVRSLNMTRLVKAGIVHTKAIVIDRKNTYVGSANFDWRALTEVKELGSVMYNCSCAGEDLQKIFDVNWLLAEPNSQIPSPWPEQYQTQYGKDSPMTINVLNNSPARMYWSTSPPQFCAGKRSTDLDAILDVIAKAQKFVYIAVMDYYAAIIYTYPDPKRYWGVLDTALRDAVFTRGIKVRMLTSNWTNTNPQQVAFLKSLNEFGKMPKIKGSLEVKQFTIPSSTIPYSRVNHNKYMVSDQTGFISTSNWSGDYFISTGGISLTINQTTINGTQSSETIQQQLEKVFLRDWESGYSHELQS